MGPHKLDTVALIAATVVVLGRGAELPSARSRIAALDRTIMVREARDGKHYGENEIDPLLWGDSDYFLKGESRRRLLGALTDVANLTDAEVKRCPASQRALVQNRVWSVFDYVWNHPIGSAGLDRELLAALARVTGKLALTLPEIAAIPDPLVKAASSAQWPAAPTHDGGADVFLPPDVAAMQAGWVGLARESGGEPTAKNHATEFGGRSMFLLRAKLPAGTPTAEAYFKAVAEVALPWIADGNGGVQLSPGFPPLPVGSEFALVRKLAVVGRDGRWHATPLTLTIQLRHYRATDRAAFLKLLSTDPEHGAGRMQSFAEFALETETVGRGEIGTMRAVLPDEKHFMFFFAHSFDQVDGAGTQGRGWEFKTGPQNMPVQACATCHTGPGLASVNSLTFFTHETPLGRLTAPGEQREADATAWWKENRAEWGGLKAFWPANLPR